MVAEKLPTAQVVYVTTTDDLRHVYRVLRDSTHVSFDIETTGTNAISDHILLLQFCGHDGVCYVVPTRGTNPTHLRCCLELLTQRTVMAHNAVFEYSFVLQHFGIRLGRVFCTMLAEAILTAGLVDLSRGLGPTVKRRLGIDLDKQEQKSFIGADPETFEPTPEQIEYAAHDVALLHDLRRVQMERLAAEGLDRTAALEFDALPVFARMSLAGMRLDLDQHAEVLASYQKEAEEAGEEARTTLGPYWEIAQERQLAERNRAYQEVVAQLEQVLPAGKVGKDTPADVRQKVTELRKARDKVKPTPAVPLSLTARLQVLAALKEAGIELPDMKAETVEEHAHENPVLGVYARWATAQKVVSTYGENLRGKVHPVTGRVHGDYNQVVSTGRTSSRDPNLQNIPPDIRACFKPEDGKLFVVADFAAMELRIAAGLSGDPVMIDAFKEGKDLHRMTAAAAWPEKYVDWAAVPKDSPDRALAKTANFAAIYGSSPQGLVSRGVIDNLQTAEEVIGGISSLYRVMWKWLLTTGEKALRSYYAETALGRRRYFRRLGPCPQDPDQAKEWRKMRGGIKRQAMNMPVQGTGADIAKRSMVLIDQSLVDGESIVGMVHDEIIVEVPAAVAESVAGMVAQAMEQAGAEIVGALPITADVHVVEKWVK